MLKGKEINIEEMVATIEEGLVNIKTSTDFNKYLLAMKNQHNHSPNNIMMAQLQLERLKGAESIVYTLKGRKQWESEGINILDNEQPLLILAPKRKSFISNNGKAINYSKLPKGKSISILGVIKDYKYGKYLISLIAVNGIETFGTLLVKGNGLLSLNKKNVLSINGEIKTLKKITYLDAKSVTDTGKMIELQQSNKLRFETVEVFDVSQTDCKIPCQELTGETNYYDLVKSQYISNGYDIREVKGTTYKGAFFPSDKHIEIKEELDSVHKLKTLTHEIGHYTIDKLNLNKESDDMSYSWEECIVEAAAFTICNSLGVDTSLYSFEYIALWQKRSGTEIRNNLKIIGTLIKAIIPEVKKAIELKEQVI